MPVRCDPSYYGKRKKRWTSRERRSTLTSRMGRSIGRFFKKFSKNLQCLGPRLSRKFGRHRRRRQDEDAINSVADCFENVEGPTFAYSCKITYVKDEPCDPCSEGCRLEDGSLAPLDQPQYRTERQSGGVTTTGQGQICTLTNNPPPSRTYYY